VTSPADLEAFVRRYFERRSAPLREEEPGVFRASLPESLRPAFDGADAIRISFDPGTAASARRVDLVAVGSYLLDRIVDREGHDGGDRAGSRPRRWDRDAAGQDDVDLEADELRGQRGQPPQVTSSKALLDDQILPRHPAQATDAEPERRDPSARISRRQHPDAIHSPRLLRLGGERRGEDATSQGAEECASVHHSIT